MEVRTQEQRERRKRDAYNAFPEAPYPKDHSSILPRLGATYYVLKEYTGSTVPVLDAFTNAMSFVGLWALARKYVEQWVFWIAVDAISCYLYIIKGIPFKAGLYGLYVIIAVMGYMKWKRMAIKE